MDIDFVKFNIFIYSLLFFCMSKQLSYSEQIEEYLKESKEYFNDKDWNKCLANLQEIKNYMNKNSANELIDKIIEYKLIEMHKLVLERFEKS